MIRTALRGRVPAALLLLAMGVLLAGCSAFDTPVTPQPSLPSVGGAAPGGGAGGNTGVVDPGVAGAPPACEACDPIDPPAGGALKVSPEPGIVDPRPHQFDHLDIASDGLTVTVYYYGGVADCYGLSSVKVDQTGDGVVKITVLEGAKARAAGTACIDIAVLKAATVVLDQPIVLPG